MNFLSTGVSLFFLFHLQAVTVQGDLSEIIAFSESRFSECSTFLETCQPTVADCATYICAECTSLGGTAINRCCAEPDPLSCFIAGAGGVAPASATAGPTSSGSSMSDITTTAAVVMTTTAVSSGAVATTTSPPSAPLTSTSGIASVSSSSSGSMGMSTISYLDGPVLAVCSIIFSLVVGIAGFAL